MRTHKTKLNETHKKVLIVFFDGAGCRPGGEGSGFAWVCSTRGMRNVERVNGLTNNQAEYHGFIAALSALPDGSSAELFSDSEVLCCQFSGQYKVNNSALLDLLAKAQALIQTKQLNVKLQWIPRAQNLAGKLL
jgi:ribonuclease HI